MGLLDFFKNDKNKVHEVLISSDRPYEVGIAEDSACKCFKTFTTNLTMKAERIYSLPVKVSYDFQNYIQLDLYIPGDSTIKSLKTVPAENMFDLWLFFDNDEFFIVYPDSIYIHEDDKIIQCHINFKDFGFHSELKKLADNYSPDKICELVCEKLVSHDIVRIEPNLMTRDRKEWDCTPVDITSETTEPLRKAIVAVSDAAKESLEK